MAFDVYAAYPRTSLAASQAAHRLALANEQLNHSDEALPASNVSPRLTTAESLAAVLANAQRGRPGARDLEAWEVLESGDKPTRKYEARFIYSDGSQRIV